MKKYIATDEEGYFALSGDLRATDEAFGQELLKNMKVGEKGSLTSVSNNAPIIIEAFDQPLVLQQLKDISGPKVNGLFNYHWEETFSLTKLRVDAWDRFRGVTNRGIPFVFSRKAQADLFNQCESFTDDSFNLNGETFSTPDFYDETSPAETPDFWQEKYTQPELPPWDLGKPHNSLETIVAQIKLGKSRVAVLGCGTGHDASFFAKKGHIVSAFDFSSNSLKLAKQNFPELKIDWIQADILELGPEHNKAYDIVFDHTLYCAIQPSRRMKLIKTWKRILAPGGHLMGIFFSMSKPFGPPYGGSEWELREQIQNDFSFRYWNRWHHSESWREDLEFIVYAQKK